MSNDWRVPTNLARDVALVNYGDAWKREIERTAEVRGILTDLIAESRAWLAGDHPEPLVWMLNRAEQRLQHTEQ